MVYLGGCLWQWWPLIGWILEAQGGWSCQQSSMTEIWCQVFELVSLRRYFWACSVSGHLLVEHLIPKSWALIWSWSLVCCYNSLHSSGKDLHLILEHCCRDLLPFSHKSISEVGHWCWAIMQSEFQFIPDGVEVRALYRPVKFFYTDWQTISVWTSLYAWGIVK